ncbi:kinase-like domain-containing protein [Pisolithus tinctorius]|nr:kinase-like domain-containing protein [Pisolithus tinctorius]
MRGQTTVQLCDANEDVDKTLISAALSPRYGYFLSTTLPMRVVTSSERHLTRLRIWLGRRVFENLGSAGVCRFGLRTVVKFNPATRFAEAASMEFVSHHTHIPVPRVHDVFVIDGRTYIVMGYINAPELTYVWHKLTEMQKKAIFAQLRDFIGQLRSLEPHHPGRVQAVDSTGLFDPRICLDDRPFGPFSSVAEFHTYFGHNCLLNLEQCRQYFPLIEAMAQRHYRIAFAHSDICPRNILARNGNVVAIVDWECAGWYPEYWEYTRWAVSNYRSPQTWLDARDNIMDVYSEELQVEDLIGGVYTRL